tara:strand:+ start:318 stop:767 length:450 start_codon:yes stop_codon:yes gene_type:complete
MGADLYLNNEYKELNERLAPKFDDAIAKRDSITDRTSEEYRLYQDRASGIYNQMNPDSCYFRDSYNVSNVLWALGLSWWEDVIPMLTNDGMLKPEKAKALIGMINDADFKDLPKEIEDIDENYFSEKRNTLVKFLQRSVDGGESVECSL